MDSVNILSLSNNTYLKVTVGTKKQDESTPVEYEQHESSREVLYKGLLIPKDQFSVKRSFSYDDLVQKGLKILQAAYTDKMKDHNVFSPEEHIANAEKYGSFQAYQQAEWSPEKVSARITGFALPRFEEWYGQGQNKKLSHDDAVDKFAEVIRNSIQTGYNRAMEMLGDIPDEVRAELEKTLQLTHEQIDVWKQQQKTPDLVNQEAAS